MSQNLISAELTAADLKTVLDSLKVIKDKLPFLSTLQGDDVQNFFKVGNAYLPFLDKISQVVDTHPEILPQIFDKDEFSKDYALVKSIHPVYVQLNELAEGVKKTYFAASSDAMIEALDVYSAVKINKNKVPGLSATADELAEFFKKTKAKDSSSTEADKTK